MQHERENDLRQRRHAKFASDYGIENSSVWIKKESICLLPNSVGFGLIIFFLVLLKFFFIFENSLPDQIKLKDAGLYPGRFIGERAELQLKRLTDLGTRVVGSYENEVLSVDFLKRELSYITQNANKNKKIEIDVQKPTGSYYLWLRPYGFRNYYANIQNFVVKLSSGDKPNKNSILMNCHYDTVPESPGASDNGINCVIMLEILRVLASEEALLKNNVIFLFNGAEENPLQASHGFLSQQKWSKEVKVLINLDSAGAGGREVLFQTSGEPWLVQAYAKAVPRPTAGVQAEELFHYGVIPSDTDFRIFRDFAGYSGFDIAHVTNGYVYHTKFDTMEFIRPGVYQNTGDNLLALVRELVNSSEVGLSQPNTRIVYFDIFTLFMIVYTEEFGILLNLVTVVLSGCAVYKSLKNLPSGRNHSILKSIFFSTGVQFLGLSLAGAVVFFTSKSLDFYRATLSWYRRPWLIIPLYSFPIASSLAAILILAQAFMKKNLLGHQIIRFINGGQLLWTLVLLVGTLKGIRTSFILMLIVLFPSLGSLCVTFIKKTYNVKTYLVAYLFSLSFPLVFTVCQCVRIFTVLIPMTARMGSYKNPEVLIGALSLLTSAIYLSQLVPFLLLLKKVKKFLISLCILHVVVMVMITGTSYGFPYDGNVQSPVLQRFYAFHSERTFHDAKGAVRRSDSGIFVLSMDRNDIKYVLKNIPELSNVRTLAEDCTKEIFCGFPVFTSRFIVPASYSYYIPTTAPTIHHPTSLEVINQTQISVNVRRIRVLVTGPDHITVGMSPRPGVELVKWSFDSSTPVCIESSNDRKTYMVYYSHGLMGGTLEFEFDLEVPYCKINRNHSDQMLDVAVIGHYMHDKKFRTSKFTKLISKFPDWAHVTPWTTTYKSWVI